MRILQKWKICLGFLLLACISVWSLAIDQKDDYLHLIACDVGQGDALLVVYKDIQFVIDGGGNNSMLRCLEKYTPAYDRKIELVVLTHPDADHFTGLIDVIENYEIEQFLFSSLDSSSQKYQLLKSMVGGRGVKVVFPEDVKSVGSDLIYLEIIHPTGDFMLSQARINENQAENQVLGAFTASDSNEFSIIAKLTFGEFDAILTGDATKDVLEKLALSNHRSVEYFKISHHGSKNNFSENLLDALKPKLAIISVGKENQYGHPNKEVLNALNDQSVKILRTDEMGDIEVVSDGEKFWIQK